MTYAGTLAESTIRFLRAHMPFSRMARGDLEFIAERRQARLLPGRHDDRRSRRRDRASTCTSSSAATSPCATSCQRIGRGSARAPASAFRSPRSPPAWRARGASRRPRTSSASSWRATTSSRCALRSRPFAEYCTSILESIVQQSLGQLRQQLQPARGGATHAARAPQGPWCAARRCTATPARPVREALEAMSRERVASIAVVDQEPPPGRHLHAHGPARPRGAAGPRSGDADRRRHDASARHARRAGDGAGRAVVDGAARLPPGDGHARGRLIGVVSERDLFALQRVTMRNIAQSIRLARDLHGAAACSAGHRRRSPTTSSRRGRRPSR